MTGVETTRGSIETEVVVNAAMFAGEIGVMGVTVPVVLMAHEYFVLEPSGLPPTCRTCADPSLLVYFRPESGGLIMGGYEQPALHRRRTSPTSTGSCSRRTGRDSRS